MSMSVFLYDHLNHKYGLQELTDWHVTSLLQSLKYFKRELRPKMFSMFVGDTARPNQPPRVDARYVAGMQAAPGAAHACTCANTE